MITARPVVIVLALALLTTSATAQPTVTLSELEREVMCVQCGTPLNLSFSAVADRERAFITRRIRSGETKEQIKNDLVAEFGSEVLAVPKGGTLGWAATLGPLTALCVAAIAVFCFVGRQRRWSDSSLRDSMTDS